MLQFVCTGAAIVFAGLSIRQLTTVENGSGQPGKRVHITFFIVFVKQDYVYLYWVFT